MILDRISPIRPLMFSRTFSIIVGYTKLQDASAQNQKDVYEAKSLAVSVQSSLIASDAAKTKEIADIKTDVAVIKNNLLTINEKLDDIRSHQK